MKTAQDYGAFYQPSMRGVTLADVYSAIRADSNLPPLNRSWLITQLEQAAQGMPSNAPASALQYRATGGVLGWLLSRYFGMGPKGQLIASLAGFGLGNRLQGLLG